MAEYFHKSGVNGAIIVCDDGRYADTIMGYSYLEEENNLTFIAKEHYESLYQEAKAAGSDLKSDKAFWGAINVMLYNLSFIRRLPQSIPKTLSEAGIHCFKHAKQELYEYVGIGEASYPAEDSIAAKRRSTRRRKTK